MDIVNSLWVEKYRPKTLEDIVIPDEYRIEFKKSFDLKETPNLLLYGPPGGGKTSLARVIVSKNGILQNPNDNLLELNGSAKESRSINFVNEVIEPFLKIPPASPDKIKIVFIDEADYLTDASFHSLRGIIEKYINHGRFIFTCNYISKIPEALQSRLTDYKFRQVTDEFVINYAKDILIKENIKYINDDLKFIVDNLYPDIRKIIGKLQRLSSSGTLKVDRNIALTKENFIVSCVSEILEYIKNKESHKIGKVITSILETLSEQDSDFREIYTKLFNKVEIPIPSKIIINKYTNTHNNCLVDSMHFMAMIFEIIQSQQNYIKSSNGG